MIFSKKNLPPNYYVYAYLRTADLTPYYIGKGKGRRAYSKNRSIHFPSDKSRIVFYQTGLKEEDAFLLEKLYIKLFGRKDLGTGVLYNMTDGGDGASGIIKSDKTRIKTSDSLKKLWQNEEYRKLIDKRIQKMLQRLDLIDKNCKQFIVK